MILHFGTNGFQNTQRILKLFILPNQLYSVFHFKKNTVDGEVVNSKLIEVLNRIQKTEEEEILSSNHKNNFALKSILSAAATVLILCVLGYKFI